MTHGVLASSTLKAANASTGERRGFHLMMKAISRCRALACAVISCIRRVLQKPESARTSNAPVTRPAAMGKARRKT